jgi:hypothetical protein
MLGNPSIPLLSQDQQCAEKELHCDIMNPKVSPVFMSRIILMLRRLRVSILMRLWRLPSHPTLKQQTIFKTNKR